MNKRPYTKANDWLPVIQEWQQSGLTKKLFCEQKAINYKVFYRWYTKLTHAELTHQRPAQKPPLLFNDFIPVDVKDVSRLPANGEQVCILRLHTKLQLHIPMTAVNTDFLRVLFESD